MEIRHRVLEELLLEQGRIGADYLLKVKRVQPEPGERLLQALAGAADQVVLMVEGIEERREVRLGGGHGVGSGGRVRDGHGLGHGSTRPGGDGAVGVGRAAGLAVPRLSVEPGRALIGPAGVTLYRVGTVKDVDGIRTYVSVDGGMSDNIRTALYDAKYTCVLANRVSVAEPMLSRVVGKHCESGDIVIRDVWLPGDVAPGDLLAVAATGAYCRSMASNYNHVPRPPVIAVEGGTARVIVRRETEDDLLTLDVG